MEQQTPEPIAPDEITGPPRLWSMGDIGRAYSRNRTAVAQWRAGKTLDFPEPTYISTGGPLWRPGIVRAWVESHRPDLEEKPLPPC